MSTYKKAPATSNNKFKSKSNFHVSISFNYTFFLSVYFICTISSIRSKKFIQTNEVHCQKQKPQSASASSSRSQFDSENQFCIRKLKEIQSMFALAPIFFHQCIISLIRKLTIYNLESGDSSRNTARENLILRQINFVEIKKVVQFKSGYGIKKIFG